jgi:hypothetical protein
MIAPLLGKGRGLRPMLGGAPVFGGKSPSTKLPSIGHYWTLSTAPAFRHKRSTTLIHSFMLNQGRGPTDLVPSIIGQQYIRIQLGQRQDMQHMNFILKGLYAAPPSRVS